MSRYTVIKHSAVIQMTNRVPALPRRLWNILLANAYDKLPTRDLFTIPSHVVRTYLDFNSHNYEYLRDALRLLVETRIEFNLLDKDKRNAWGTSSLLSSAILYHNTIEYGYSPHFRRLLYQPSMYARIPLLLPSQFKSKHTLPLYELCLDYFNEEQRSGETPAMPIEVFKNMFDVPNYAFEDISKRILNVAIAEITALTPLRVEVRLKRYGRKVTDIKFVIRYAEPAIDEVSGTLTERLQAPYQQKKSTTNTKKQSHLFTPSPSDTSSQHQTITGVQSSLYAPRDYDALFATLSPEQQQSIMERAEAALPRLLSEYVQHNPRTFERLAQPTILEHRNTFLEEYLREQEFRATSTIIIPQ